jgi:hypothetical protein
MDFIARAKTLPNENLALIGQRFQTLREIQWPAIRWHVAQISQSTSCIAVDNEEMSVSFDGSIFRCFAADRLDKMLGLRFTRILFLEEITESELITLVETYVIPPRYAPTTEPDTLLIFFPPKVPDDR